MRLILCLSLLLCLAASEQPNTPDRLVVPSIWLDGAIRPVGIKTITIDGEKHRIWDTLDHDVAWHNRSALLGQIGNTVLSGHSDVKGRVFRHLEDIAIGDQIVVYSRRGQPHYFFVTDKIVVREKGVPLQVRLKNAQWIAPTSDERLTLVTCAYPGATHRLIVIARP